MRYRNAMDRLLSIQRGINFGEFPSPDLVNNGLEISEVDGVQVDSLDPRKILQYSTYLFRNCGVEAWVQATETLIGLLDIRINSISYDGEKTKANRLLKESLKLQANGRLARSSSHLYSVDHYKKASEKAVAGLDLLNKVNPYTVSSFWVAIIMLIISFISVFLTIFLTN